MVGAEENRAGRPTHCQDDDVKAQETRRRIWMWIWMCRSVAAT